MERQMVFLSNRFNALSLPTVETFPLSTWSRRKYGQLDSQFLFYVCPTRHFGFWVWGFLHCLLARDICLHNVFTHIQSRLRPCSVFYFLRFDERRDGGNMTFACITHFS
jgi:hypothetical protein